jgi:hypothetical protein
VGEAPGRVAIPSPQFGTALQGRTGANLAKIAGWPAGLYLVGTDRRNLFYDPQPAWNTHVARMSALRMRDTFHDDKVILLGVKVAEAFGLADLPMYTWRAERNFNVARIPHPSGKNHAWNDPAERERARKFLKPLI